MAYTTPTTRAHLDTMSAANWNTDVVDNEKWLAGDSGGKPSCRVYNSGNLAIVTATPTILTFDSERWDNGGLHSTSVATGRITIPSGGGGKYLIGGTVTFAANATGQRIVEILLNGTTVIDRKSDLGLSADLSSLPISTMYALVATDYVELRVYQNSGGNLNVNASGNYSPEFYAMWQAL